MVPPVRRAGCLARLAIALLLWGCDAEPQPAANDDVPDGRPLEVSGDGYVTSGACRSCHPDQYASWFASYHRTMTQIASPESVVAPFDATRLEAYGRSYRLERHGDDFWVEMDDPAWPDADGETPPRVRRRIVMTTGSHHQQLYWFAAGAERMVGLFPFLYLIGQQQWVPFPANFLVEPVPEGMRLPLGELLGKWNRTCINCHATRGQQRVRSPQRMDTEVAEFGIACEACHGPGERHVRVNHDPERRYELHLTDGADPTIVNPADLPPHLASQVCGQCHSTFTTVRRKAEVGRWNEQGFAYRPGDNLTHSRYLVGYNDEMNSPTMRAFHAAQPNYLRDRFWSDGEIRVSGRDYSAMIESPCYTRGAESRRITCLSCHTLHKPSDDPRPLSAWADDQLALGMDGDAACASCHPKLAADLEAHSHHPPASEGSRCQNCHMPYTTYGLLKAIRSHRIHSPSAVESVETGRPNACNQCHQDQTLAWAADWLATWYDAPVPEFSEDERNVAAMVLWALRGDAGQRALAAWSLGWGPARRASGGKWVVPYLAQLLSDPYDAVRYIAWQSLRSQPGFRDLDYDFMAPARERDAVRLRLLRGWHRTRASAQRPTGAPILITPDGTLDWTRFEQLLRQRDETPVNLAE